jgi:cell fate (sporulation/competence/biofilm development) regulator YlbF (YheA/YmcA/DUF963 family)
MKTQHIKIYVSHLKESLEENINLNAYIWKEERLKNIIKDLTQEGSVSSL